MSDFKFKCPHCNQKIRVGDDLVGETIQCPTCQGSIEVRKPESPTPPPVAVGDRSTPDPKLSEATASSTTTQNNTPTRTPHSPRRRKALFLVSGIAAVALVVIASAFWMLDNPNKRIASIAEAIAESVYDQGDYSALHVSYGVRRTDSLTTPLAATICFSCSDVKAYRTLGDVRLVMGLQDGKWVLTDCTYDYEPIHIVGLQDIGGEHGASLRYTGWGDTIIRITEAVLGGESREQIAKEEQAEKLREEAKRKTLIGSYRARHPESKNLHDSAVEWKAALETMDTSGNAEVKAASAVLRSVLSVDEDRSTPSTPQVSPEPAEEVEKAKKTQKAAENQQLAEKLFSELCMTPEVELSLRAKNAGIKKTDLMFVGKDYAAVRELVAKKDWLALVARRTQRLLKDWSDIDAYELENAFKEVRSYTLTHLFVRMDTSRLLRPVLISYGDDRDNHTTRLSPIIVGRAAEQHPDKTGWLVMLQLSDGPFILELYQDRVNGDADYRRNEDYDEIWKKINETGRRILLKEISALSKKNELGEITEQQLRDGIRRKKMAEWSWVKQWLMTRK